MHYHPIADVSFDLYHRALVLADAGARPGRRDLPGVHDDDDRLSDGTDEHVEHWSIPSRRHRRMDAFRPTSCRPIARSTATSSSTRPAGDRRARASAAIRPAPAAAGTSATPCFPSPPATTRRWRTAGLDRRAPGGRAGLPGADPDAGRRAGARLDRDRHRGQRSLPEFLETIVAAARSEHVDPALLLASRRGAALRAAWTSTSPGCAATPCRAPMAPGRPGPRTPAAGALPALDATSDEILAVGEQCWPRRRRAASGSASRSIRPCRPPRSRTWSGERPATFPEAIEETARPWIGRATSSSSTIWPRCRARIGCG